MLPQKSLVARVGTLVVMVGCFLGSFASAIDPIVKAATDVGRESPEEVRFDYMRQSAEAYEFHRIPGGELLKLSPQPLTRWSNPISGIADGIVSLWTDDGVPEVVAQVYLTRTNIWIHEFQSLTDSSITLAVPPSSESLWSPTRSVQRQVVPKSPIPAARRSRRIAQMKQIAKRFSARVRFRPDVTKSKIEPYELRCLPQPIYRYQSERRKITDGAMFAFVQGTNPEVFLIVEAVSDSDDHFRYGLSAMTGYEVSAALDGLEVWRQPPQKRPWPNDGPYFSLHYQHVD